MHNEAWINYSYRSLQNLSFEPEQYKLYNIETNYNPHMKEVLDVCYLTSVLQKIEIRVSPLRESKGGKSRQDWYRSLLPKTWWQARFSH